MTRYVYRHMHHALAALLDHGIRTVDKSGTEFTMERLCDFIRSGAQGVECFVMAEDEPKLEIKVGDTLEIRERYLGDEEEHVVRSLYYVTHKNSKGLTVNIAEIEGGWNPDDPINRLIDKRYLADPTKKISVIHRDGKPFPWPEPVA